MTGYILLDHIGNWAGDPGTGWDVAGVTNATRDHTLVRKASVTGPNPCWDQTCGNSSAGTNASDSEWIVYPQNTWTYLGSHPQTAVTLTANFSASDSTLCQVNSVTFTDLSTGTPTSWAWDFGDGTTSTLQNPTHTYTTAGSYNVALTVNGSADTETKTGFITVNSELDWANLQHPASGSIACGGTFDIYGQVYEPGLTNADPNAAGQGLTVEFWLQHQ